MESVSLFSVAEQIPRLNNWPGMKDSELRGNVLNFPLENRREDEKKVYGYR